MEYTHRLQILYDVLAGKPIHYVARKHKVNRKTVYAISKVYNKEGLPGLQNKELGRPFEPLNPKAKQLIILAYENNKCGINKLWSKLKQAGFSMSHDKIYQTLKEMGLTEPCRNQQKQRKFVKYEYENNDDLWHTDWTVCPFTNQPMISFIDDHSRFCTNARHFKEATAENSIIALKEAIDKWGRKPKAILTDNGTQFTPANTNKKTKGTFNQALEELGIKHILGRIHHPQTNGKVKRWFGSYKQENKLHKKSLQKWVTFYNEERIHQGINYQTPAERYIEKKCPSITIQ